MCIRDSINAEYGGEITEMVGWCAWAHQFDLLCLCRLFGVKLGEGGVGHEFLRGLRLCGIGCVFALPACWFVQQALELGFTHRLSLLVPPTALCGVLFWVNIVEAMYGQGLEYTKLAQSPDLSADTSTERAPEQQLVAQKRRSPQASAAEDGCADDEADGHGEAGYCTICELSDRQCTHCFDCGVCHPLRDHHCGVIGVCVHLSLIHI
eukprot:TRINITY_DN2041_c0_g1_i2.p1 TRINITY_DN2041_c0_g1~~TRINITY_DN2041_c0_g1_i2.p1  ORF type:complete len:208 (-),score=38.86 TRINITY_DN2041_c0_g1_i2:127-750(-)